MTSAIRVARVPLGSGASTGASRTSWSEARSALLAIPILAGILLGMALGLGPLVTVSALAALGLAIVVPFGGLAILAFMAPLVPPPVIPAPGFIPMMVGALLLGCLYRLPIDRPALRVPIPLVLLLAFFGYVTVQQLPDLLAGYSGVAGHRIGYLYIQLATVVGATVAAAYILSNRRPGPILLMGITSACLAAILALASPDNLTADTLLAGLLAESEDSTRAVGTFGNPNYFGHFLAAAIASAAAWAMATPDRRLRGALFGAAVVASVSLTMSLSRGAIAALLAGLVALAFIRGRATGVAAVGLSLIGVLFVYPAFVRLRLETLTGSASGAAYHALESSDAGRLDAVLAGPQLFLSSPLSGVGFGQYSELSSQFTANRIAIGSHNWYMSVLAEQGIVGVVLWATLLASVVIALWARPRVPRMVGLTVLTVFVAGSFFVTQPVSFQTAILPVLVITAALVSDWSPSKSSRGLHDPSVAGGA